MNTFLMHFLLNMFLTDKPLGFTVLGGAMFARGTGREHWDEVMKHQKEYIQKWHTLQEVISLDGGGSGGAPNSLELPGGAGGSRSRRGSSCLSIPEADLGKRRQRSASICSFTKK